MNVAQILSPLFSLIASIMYLVIFLFIIHNAVIRLTPYKSRISKAIIATGFLAFTYSLYSWMAYKGYGLNTYLLPSHLFVLGLTWAEFYRTGKVEQ